MPGLLIGEVARRAGVPAATIRYYESLGLMKPAGRSASGYRRYGEPAIEELRFIRKAQSLGFSLDEIGEILNLARSGTVPCSRVLSLAHQHLDAVEERIRQLQQFRDALSNEIRRWDEQTAAACDGVCHLIASASDTTHPLVLRLEVPDGGRRTNMRRKKS